MHFGRRSGSIYSVLAYGIFTLSMTTASAQMIVAHRGASFDAPENTLAAVREAWVQQADGVEADFHVTQDGQIVCIHDANTERTTGVKRVVADSTLAELRQLEYGAWKHERFAGEPIPTFAEVMANVPEGKLFVIELKTGPEIVPLLRRELDRLSPVDCDLMIIAFNQETVAECKRQMPEIRAHWLTGYKQDKATGIWTPTADQVLRALAATGADGLGTQGNRQVVDAEYISYLKEHGMREFHVWTIDDPEDARYYQSLGPIAITTNRPALIRDALSASSRDTAGR